MYLSYESFAVVLLKIRLRLQCRKHTYNCLLDAVCTWHKRKSFISLARITANRKFMQPRSWRGCRERNCASGMFETKISFSKFAFWICCLQHPETFLSFILRANETRVKIGHYDSRTRWITIVLRNDVRASSFCENRRDSIPVRQSVLCRVNCRGEEWEERKKIERVGLQRLTLCGRSGGYIRFRVPALESWVAADSVALCHPW